MGGLLGWFGGAPVWSSIASFPASTIGGVSWWLKLRIQWIREGDRNRQKLRIRWIGEGGKNTKVFHQSTIIKGCMN